ncbi:hypothetical protein CBW65_20105 [Tumebacillus avium]|uniref:DUF3189 domain-containing protein n=1 Tax=Tumebacillus avium TaxID=1903704 RepID=A0A1Y0ISN4_9BACL|nr:DUF3189 family protein [Tumebacillus avium]ARU63019.1 hypothetical protein CBW65_20105 [Tumebacillus avium]
MHVIYHCYGSAHSSVVAAAIHLGRLPADRVPNHQEVLHLADYDKVESWQIGTLFFKGQDEWGNAVYTLGLGKDAKRSKQAAVTLIELLAVDTSQLFFNEALPHINTLAKIGGAVSRRYGMVRWGRPLSAFGIRKSYWQLVRFVEQVKADERRRMEGLGGNG